MTFLLLWSLRATAVILLGGVLTLALRRRSAATRSLVLRATLAVACLLPLAMTFAPRVEIALPDPPAVAPQAAPSILGKRSVNPMPVAEAWSVIQSDPKALSTLGFEHQTPLHATWIPAVSLLCLVWFGGTGLLVLRWLTAWTRLCRITRRGELFGDDPSLRLAAVSVPMTFGWIVVLPLEAKHWPEARVRAAILHERAHVRRGDWAWQTLAAAFAALHWPNPATWLLTRLVRDAAEMAADDETIAHMAPSDYARELLAVASVAVRPADSALTMARRGGVRDRVVAILATRNRSRPTRRLTALLLGALAALGLGVAGITRQERNRDEPPRLIAVRERTADGVRAWRADGTPIADPGPTPGVWTLPSVPPPPSEKRRLQVLLDVPAIPYRLGGPRIQFQTTDDTTPFLIVPVAGIRQDRSTVQLNLEADTHGSEATTLRVGVPFGPKVPLGSADPAFTVERLHQTKLVDGKAVPEVRVYTADPKGVEGQLEFDAYGPDGKSLPKAGTGWLYHDGRFCGTFATAGRVARIALLAQRYRWTTLRNVPLRPTAPAPAKGETLRRVALGEVAQASLPSKPLTSVPMEAVAAGGVPSRVELIALADPDGRRTWLPDGRPGLALSVVDFRSPTRPGWRRLVLKFRITGVGSISRPYALATVWGKYAYPSDRFVFQATDKPDEKILWCSVQMRRDVRVAKAGLDFFVDSLRTVTDAVPGVGVGQATVRSNGVSRGSSNTVFNEYEVTFNGLIPPGRDHYSELQTYNAEGKLRNTYAMALPLGRHGGYSVNLIAPDTPGRFVLRSCKIDHTRFEGVHLQPNP